MKHIIASGVLIVLLIAAFLSPVTNAHAASVHYAIPSGLTSGDCSSWATACTLQRAISQAVSGDQIWVATGIYKPTTDTDRTKYFSLVSGVAIYGGFPSTGTPTFADRDPDAYLTILSGDLGNDDTNTNGVVTNYTNVVGDNSYKVVNIPTNATSATRLDGFTITGGYNNKDSYSNGGGIVMYSGSPTFNNLHISGNYALQYGGGMYNGGGSPILTNVIFLGNGASSSSASSGGGGGIYTTGVSTSTSFTNVDFIRNYGKSAGAILKYAGSLSLTNVGFYGNKSSGSGAAIYYMEAGTDTLTNVAFVGQSGSVAAYFYFADPIITNATFAMNANGDLSCVSYANPSLVNSIFYNSITNCSGSSSDHTSSGINPGFMRNPNSGLDGVWGTEDDDYGDINLIPTSSVIDSGNNNAAGLTGITTDLAGRNRFLDVAAIADTGSGDAPIVDRGAYESDGIAPDLIASLANDTLGEVTYGDAFTWTLTVTNTGVISASFTSAQIILRDDLPSSGATYGTPVVQNSSGITGAIDCPITGNTLTCSANGAVSLAEAGGKFEVAIPVTPSAAGTLANPRNSGSCSVDPNGVIVETGETNNACNSDSVTVLTPDLIASLANDTLGEVAYGNAFTWTLTVTNTGVLTASFTTSQTILQDNLPSAGAVYGTPVVQNSSGINGTISCDISSNTLTCSADGPVTMEDSGGKFEVAVPVTPSAAGTLANPRSGGSCSVDPNGVIVETSETNNTCNSDSVTVLTPDLIASLANNVSGEASYGNVFTWTLTVTNTDVLTASFTSAQTILQDDLPSAGVTYSTPVVQNSSGLIGNIGCNITNSTLTCSADGALLLAKSGGKFEVAIPVTPTALGSLSNPRIAGACKVDPNSVVVETNDTNNDCNADSVTVSKATAIVNLSNLNQVYDGNPKPVTVATVPVGLSVDVTYGGSATPPTNIGIYTVIGSINETNYQGVATETLTVHALPITVTAVTDSKPYDGNTSSTGVPTITGGSLVISDTAVWTQTFATKDVAPGKTLTPSGTISDGNGGDNYDVTYVSIHTGEITPVGLTVKANDETKYYADPLPAFTAVYTGFVNNETKAVLGGTLSFSTTATQISLPGDYDVMPTGLTSTNYNLSFEKGILHVVPMSDLELTMSASADPSLAGADLVYTLAATNHGPSDATQVILTDTLPSHVSFNSASAGCSENLGMITCNLGSLAANASLTSTITVTVDRTMLGSLFNSATLSGDEEDSNLANNEDSINVQVAPSIVVYNNNFETGTGNGWYSTVITGASPTGSRRFLGEFDTQEDVRLSIPDLPDHTRVTLSFDLFIIRSWDGDFNDGMVGPDRWQVLAGDGVNSPLKIIDTTFSNWNGYSQSYPGNYPGTQNISLTGADEINTLGYMWNSIPMDAVYNLEFTFEHVGSTLALDFAGLGLQGITDESWGLDNIKVIISAGAELNPNSVFLPFLIR